MKKAILSIIVLSALILVGCDSSDVNGHKFIDIEPGYELVSAEFDYYGGTVSCFLRKASPDYEPTQKSLIVFGSECDEKIHYYFKEQYGNQSKKRNAAVIKYLCDNDFIGDSDSVVCVANEIRVIKIKE